MLDPSSLLLAACANCTPASPSVGDSPTPSCDQIQTPLLTAQSDAPASACVSNPETDEVFLLSSRSQPSTLSPTFTSADSFSGARPRTRIGRLHQELKSATCSNDWDLALDAASQLIGSNGLTDASRQEFIQFRYRLQNWSVEDATVAVVDCGERVATASTLTPSQRLAARNSLDFTAATFSQMSRSNIEHHHEELKVAACLNDWETAIDANQPVNWIRWSDRRVPSRVHPVSLSPAKLARRRCESDCGRL